MQTYLLAKEKKTKIQTKILALKSKK